MATFQLFFQSREQVVVRRGQIRRIGWVIKTLETQVGQCLLDCKFPVSRGIVVQEQEPLSDISVASFASKCPSVALWKIINVEDAVFIPQKIEARHFQRIFALGIFWGVVSRYAATPLIVALSLGHRDITRFRP